MQATYRKKIATSIVGILAATFWIFSNSSQDRGQQQINKADLPSNLPMDLIPPVDKLINAQPSESGLTGLKKHFQLIEKASASHEPIPMDYTLGPTANRAQADFVRSKFQEKLKFFQSLGLTELNLHWVIVSENDHDWWVDFRTNQFAKYPVELWDVESNMFGHCVLYSDIFCGAGNGVNDGFYQDTVIGTEFTDRGLEQVTRHESTHFYQSKIGFIETCWFVEGQATFFETYLESTARSREKIIDRLVLSKTKISERSQQEIEQKLNRNSICDGDPDVRYDLGMLIFEYLYQNYSVKDIDELLVQTNQSSWPEATKSVLEVDEQVLNSQISQYLFEQFN